MQHSYPPHSHRKQAGFTLVELLISLVIAGIISIGVFDIYLSFFQSTERQDQVLEMQQNARVAIDDLERDLRLAGVDVTRNDGVLPNQAVFAYGAPYEIIFNANVDGTRGGIKRSASPSSIPFGGAVTTPFYAPAVDYPLAETIRWTLDSSNDGIIGADDKMNTDNPNLYRLTRQVYGINGAGNSNGPESATASEGVRGPEVYSDGSRPPVLFQYWIKEWDANTNRAADASEDINGNGVLDAFLWGDSNSNGILDPAEITDLMTGNNGGPKVIDGFNAPITPTTGDTRIQALSMTRAQALSNISRVVVSLVTETQKPDPNYNSSPHGSAYKYREQQVVSSVTPRNVLNDVTSDLVMTLTAASLEVTCPAVNTLLTLRLFKSDGSPYTAATQVDLTTSQGVLSPTNTAAETITVTGGTATATITADANSISATAVINASTTILGTPLYAATVVTFLPSAPTQISLSANPAALPADGVSTSRITATLLDDCGKPAGDNGTIAWSLSESLPGIGGTISPIGAGPPFLVSGNSATADLKAGNTAAIATVSATYNGAATGTTTVNYTNCSILVTPALSTIPANGTSQTAISLKLLNLVGVPQPGVDITVTTDGGSINGPPNPQTKTVTTAADGSATVTLTSDNLPHIADIIAQVSPIGAVCPAAVGSTTVEFSDCSMLVTSSVPEVIPGNPGGTATITAKVTNGGTGLGLPNQPISFSYDAALGNGTINPTTGTTDAGGFATTTFTAGAQNGTQETIQVSSACGSGSASIFVRDCDVSVSASPQVIPPAFGNSTVISATVTSSNTGSAPLAGRSVRFTLSDPSLATLSTPTTVLTDINGVATVTLNSAGLAGTVAVIATTDCGSASTDVVLNDWQLAINAANSSVSQGGSLAIVTTLTNGGIPSVPTGGTNVVLNMAGSGTPGSLIAPPTMTVIGGLTSHLFTAGSTSGTVTITASTTVLGFPLTASVDITVTSPTAGSPLVLNIGSPNTCGGGNDKVAFSIRNTGVTDLTILSMAIQWTGGGKLDKIKTEGQTSDCKGGGTAWKDSCTGAAPTKKPKSTASITGFCNSQNMDIPVGGTYVINELKIKNVDMRGQNFNIIVTHEPVGGGPVGTSTISFTTPPL